MERAGDDLEIRPGLPARLSGAAIPLGAVLLVLWAASRGALRSTPSDPVPPAAVAAVTLLGCVVLSYRALTQRAVLGASALHCRNLLVSFAVEWGRVEAIDVVRRPALIQLEVRVRDLRRRQRIGAATRFDETSFDEVVEVLCSHPVAARLLDDPTPPVPG